MTALFAEVIVAEVEEAVDEAAESNPQIGASTPNLSGQQTYHHGCPPLQQNRRSRTKTSCVLGPQMRPSFSRSTDLYQVDSYPTYHPTCSAFNALVDLVFEELSLADTDVMKRLSKGMLSYYVTGLIWVRVLSLKQISGQALTNAERAVIDALSEGTFNVPHHRSSLSFDDLANLMKYNVIRASRPDNASYYAIVESVRRDMGLPKGTIIPLTFGAVAQADEVVKTIPVGAWVPTSVPLNATANRKLIAMRVVSRILDGTKAFKIESISFKNLPSGGDLSQVVKILPDDEGTVVNTEARSQIRDFQQDSAGIVGKRICFSYYLVKAGSVAARYANWCCLTNNDGQAVVGVAWYNNRNKHREYPEILQLERFATGSRLAGDFRRLCLETMLLTKSSR